MEGRTDRSLVKALWRGALNLLFPLHCALCSRPLDPLRPFPLCRACWNSLPRIEQPYCPRCGKPVVSRVRVPFDTPCGDCRLSRYGFGIGRSAGRYEAALKDCVHLFKYRDRRELARPLARLMAESSASLFGGCSYDGIVPVPLHPSKLRERGYNQALLLAREFGARAGIPVLTKALARTERRRPQSLLKGEERARNVRGAFRAGREGVVVGTRLLLVDDVFTTGATVNECVRVLIGAGARSVDVYTVARAV